MEPRVLQALESSITALSYVSNQFTIVDPVITKLLAHDIKVSSRLCCTRASSLARAIIKFEEKMIFLEIVQAVFGAWSLTRNLNVILNNP